jgi:peptidyl-prolyl cis-trans isomerase C
MHKISGILITAALIGGCSSGGHSGAVQMTTSGKIVETVNGQAVPESLLDAVARQHNLHLEKPGARDQALNLLTDMIIVAQAAQHEPFTSDETYQAEIEAMRLKGVADATFGQYEKATTLTDDMLRAEYEAESKKAGNHIYDFGQLLFADEGDAMTAEGDLDAGKPFSEVFDAYRTKAKQAKMFTRVRADQIPEPLAQALASLKNGESTKVPVKTEYGYHVVHLDIVNPYTPPPFEQVKEGIRRATQVKIGQERMKKLRELAKIEYAAGSAPAAQAARGAPAAPAASK